MKQKEENPRWKGEMEKQLHYQRLNSQLSSQSIPRKHQTISDVDNSLAVPYLRAPSISPSHSPFERVAARNVC